MQATPPNSQRSRGYKNQKSKSVVSCFLCQGDTAVLLMSSCPSSVMSLSLSFLPFIVFASASCSLRSSGCPDRNSSQQPNLHDEIIGYAHCEAVQLDSLLRRYTYTDVYAYTQYIICRALELLNWQFIEHL